MKAAVLHAIGDLRVEDVPIKPPGPGEVAVRVTACGICGSDLQRFHETGAYHYPMICGHEFAGAIAATGVRHLDPGQQVSVIPLIPCGKCRYCLARMPFHCENYDFIGSRRDGGFAEKVLVAAANVVPISSAVSAEAVALTEPAAVGCHCARSADIRPGDTVLVFGAGAIGIFVAQWARIMGAAHVLVADVRRKAVAVAESCGLQGVDVSTTSALEVVSEVTHGLGADVVVEAAGAANATTASFDCVRRRGTVVLIGRIDGEYLMPGPTLTSILRKEIRVQGVWGFDHWRFPHNDWQLACDALADGRLLSWPLITHRFALSEMVEAVEMMTTGNEYYCKVLIIP